MLLFLLQGNPSYTRPPPLKPGGYELYDSCVDNVSNPTMHIVFERDQCYPKYLIEYEMWESAPNVSARSSGSALKGRQTYLHNSDNYLPPKDTSCNSQYPNIASASSTTQTYQHDSDNYSPFQETNCSTQYPDIGSASSGRRTYARGSENNSRFKESIYHTQYPDTGSASSARQRHSEISDFYPSHQHEHYSTQCHDMSSQSVKTASALQLTSPYAGSSNSMSSTSTFTSFHADSSNTKPSISTQQDTNSVFLSLPVFNVPLSATDGQSNFQLSKSEDRCIIQ